MEIELTYDDEIMHSDDKAAIAWSEHYLKTHRNTLFNEEIGDAVGDVVITKWEGVSI